MPLMIEWLLKNCSKEEIFFMAELASKRTHFALLSSIVAKLTKYNVEAVFYKEITSEQELALFRSRKRGEVAGLNAFLIACKAARKEIEKRKDIE